MDRISTQCGICDKAHEVQNFPGLGDPEGATCPDCIVRVDEWLRDFQKWGRDLGLDRACKNLIADLAQTDMGDGLRSHIICVVQDTIQDWDELEGA